MRVLAYFVTLLVGYVVWRLLAPYIGVGGFFVGVFIAFILQPIVYALFGASTGGENSGSSDQAKRG